MAQVTKKLINTIDNCVDENIDGFLRVNQGLCLLKGHRVILRRDIEKYKQHGLVTSLTGGGSGHEPAFTGYVGPGMMSAAVQGAIFASPSPTPILAALRVLGKNHPAGVIVVYNNYTGDRLNFGLAIERAKAEGIKVGMLVNSCDCALLKGRDRTAGRRGLTGIVFLCKVVGSMAEEGRSFDEIMKVGTSLVQNIGTIGVCLSPCSLPGRPPMFEVANDAIEIGLGLHGEAGVETSKMMSAADCVTAMLDHMTDVNNKNHFPIKPGGHLAVAVNNLGSTTELEINILVKEIIEQLETRGIVVDRVYVNRFATSLEMAGFGVTLMHLDTEIKKCLDAPTKAVSWVQPYLMDNQRDRQPSVHIFDGISGDDNAEKNALRGPVLDRATSDLVYQFLHSACISLVAAETQLNQLDSESGDGDCGTTMKAGAQAILTALGSISSPGLPVTHPCTLLNTMASLVEQSMGGSSGALYSLFFTAAASSLTDSASFDTLVKAVGAGIQVMSNYGGARPGDRTMLDPLNEAHLALTKHQSSVLDTLRAAAMAAEKSALETTNMQASAGRASYVSSDHLNHPDPGATGVAVWMKAGVEAMAEKLN